MSDRGLHGDWDNPDDDPNQPIEAEAPAADPWAWAAWRIIALAYAVALLGLLALAWTGAA